MYYFQISDRTFINTYLDVASLVSWIGCLYFFGWFTYKAEICLKLYRKLSDFVLFGKPKDFDSENKKLNRLSAAHNIYILIAVMGMTLGPLLEEKRCEMENSRRNWNEVCGTMGAAWWPVDYSSYPYKQIYYGYQIICSFLLYRNASMAAFAIMESTEHVTIRLRHVKSVFTDALNAKTAREKRQQFGRAVRYHNEVIK
ncbi:hypothetical protein JTB14_024229 [Gonioctena quinquepunctata]|nr:hypothetical protein JTB14_024229 [Gonioctena quinquepunctata]